MDKTCQYCGLKYNNNNYKYCSDICKLAAKRGRKSLCLSSEQIDNSICIECGSPIDNPNYRKIRCRACQAKRDMESRKRTRQQKQLEKKSYYIYKMDSVLGDKSRMPSITEAVKKATEMHISYGEYIALVKDNRV